MRGRDVLLFQFCAFNHTGTNFFSRIKLIANINVLWRNFNIWAEPKCELMNSNPNLLIGTNASKALCERLIMWCTIFSKSQLCVPKQKPVMCEEVWISVTVIGCSHCVSVTECTCTMCICVWLWSVVLFSGWVFLANTLTKESWVCLKAAVVRQVFHQFECSCAHLVVSMSVSVLRSRSTLVLQKSQ